MLFNFRLNAVIIIAICCNALVLLNTLSRFDQHTPRRLAYRDCPIMLGIPIAS